MSADHMEELKEQAARRHEQYIDATVEVLCQALKDVAGNYPSDRVRDKLRDAICFDI